MSACTGKKGRNYLLKNEGGGINGLEILNAYSSRMFKNKQFFKYTVHVIVIWLMKIMKIFRFYF